MSNLVLPIVTILFSLFFLYASLSIPETIRRIGLGPAVWPQAVLFIMLFLGSVLLVKELLVNKREKAKKALAGEAGQTDAHIKDGEKNTYVNWCVAAVCCLYFYSMGWLGFVPATFLFVIAMAIILGMRRWGVILLVSCVFTLLIGFVFMRVLNTPLPRGIGIFQTLNLFFTQF